jgi:hypothetical protein
VLFFSLRWLLKSFMIKKFYAVIISKNSKCIIILEFKVFVKLSETILRQKISLVRFLEEALCPYGHMDSLLIFLSVIKRLEANTIIYIKNFFIEFGRYLLHCPDSNHSKCFYRLKQFLRIKPFLNLFNHFSRRGISGSF